MESQSRIETSYIGEIQMKPVVITKLDGETFEFKKIIGIEYSLEEMQDIRWLITAEELEQYMIEQFTKYIRNGSFRH